MKKWIVLLMALLIITLTGCEATSDNNSDNDQDMVTVYFNVYGGSVVDLITLEKGGTISPPIEPLRTGYTFDGWFYDTDYLIPFNFDASINSNTQVHAKWLQNNTDDNDTATITFDTNGGSSISPLTGNVGNTFTLPVPIRSGHTFDGWFTNTTLTTPFTGSIIPNTDITLYAKWIETTTTPDTATITFNTNGGSSISPLTGNVGDSFTLPTPTKANHTFDGWFINSTLTTSFTGATIPNTNITLYAKWIENTTTPDTATITFNTNGGSSISPLTGNVGDSFNLPTPTKADYTFDGWFTNSALTTSFTSSTIPNTNITLYAKWIETTTTPDTTTITFNTNGGSSISPLTGNVGDSFTLPTPTKSDYTFNGWFTNSALTTSFTSSTIPNTDITLYAKWTENTPDTIIVSFNVNGGSPITPVTIEVGTSYWPVPTPTRSGYDFLGWYTNDALTIEHTQTNTLTTNTTLYASWQETVSNLTLFTATLENVYDFTCNSTTCIFYLASNIYYQYHIDTNSFSFTSITDDTDGSMYRQKEEIIIIDENWDAIYTYDLEEDYGIYYYTYFTYTGNVLTNIYSDQRFSSNYDTRSQMITDARNRITQLSSFIEAIFEDANLTFDDLK